VLEHPREVKQKIGYLPETPPLYPSMTVQDYITFAAKIKNVADPKKATAAVIDRVGLSEVAHRIIDHLSKGYRQRVGLAQALVHQPDVLVLDEPTSGLDPAQRKEIRDLLIELAAGDRTVILSTHVLGEIEAVCERVIIIERGQIIAQDTIANLRGANSQVRLEVARPGQVISEALSAVDGVVEVRAQDGGIYIVSATGDRREQLAAAAIPAGLLAMGQAEQLEDIYLRLTKGDSQ
ncbi:MAG: ABC-2 type transport system ATP-binding protein, partial [Myxococcota bacterium]